METIFCPWAPAQYLIFSSSVPQILYYALVPGMAVSLFLSAFIFFNNKTSLTSKLLLFISICFFIWGFLALILFATNNPETVMTLWSLVILVEPFIYGSSLYLAYVFFDKKDISFFKKILIIALLSPFIIYLPTKYNLVGVTISDCTAIEGVIALYVTYVIEILFALWILILAIMRYRKTADAIFKKQILLFTFGILFFLLTFSSGNIIGSFTSDWVASQYGYFGMPIFIGFLAYLIVQYKAFNVQLLRAQALVFAIIILIASEFFFVRNPINIVLTAITLALIIAFGWWLVRSVKQEIHQREQMEQLARELAEANKRRARINKELAQANAKLKKLDEAKSEFISIASHQLRTPLTAIKGYGSMLLDGDFGELREQRQRDAIEKMFISNNRLIALVENLLNVSRIESGRLKFDFKEQQLETLVSESITTMQKSAENAGLYLKLKKPAKPLPMVYMDDEKIRQVALNFIDNAIKYTRAGGITVSLFAENSSVVCKVADTGIGVSETDKSRLFQKFTRGKDAFLVNTEGTGLGLYVAHMMIASHQGKIWVESDGAGKGSKFCFSLPVATSSAAKQLKAEMAKEQAANGQKVAAPQKKAGAQKVDVNTIKK